ncbi:MAG: prolipoprotein diacylglyceryl transferase [Oscillospiraceae bacterium]|nr:prolipoprotein diacylglyceryl transferase [Oscillospiraceae bacterium]
MLPHIKIFNITIHTFDLTAIAGMLVIFGILILLCSPLFSKNRSLDKKIAMRAYAAAIAGAVIGAVLLRPLTKIPEAISQWDRFSDMPQEALIDFLFGEIVFYGGLIGGAVAVYIVCKISCIPVIPIFDAMAAAVPLGHAVGRLGCLFAGCCYGVHVSESHPFSIIYPPESLSAPPGVPILAVPAIEAASLVCIFAVVLYFYARSRVKGLCIGLYLTLYSIMRFILEFYRGDPIRGVYGAFSTSHYISIGVFAAGVSFLAYARREKMMDQVTERR